MQTTDQSEIIITILEHHNIPYWESGKNVSENTINIQCPFSDCGDDSNHCGIFRDSLFWHCWKCDRRGHLAFLLAVITHRKVQECQEEIEALGFSFSEDALEQAQAILDGEGSRDVVKEKKSGVGWPKYNEPITTETDFELLEVYLQRRKISKTTLIEYNCGVCRVGEYMNRIIIPIYFEDKLVSYQAADLTGRAGVKYRTALSDVNDYLYGWDRLPSGTKFVVLVEGILDAWRLRHDVLATFGTSLTDRQRNLLVSLHLDQLVVCWDGDAWLHSCKEVENLRAVVNKVEVIRMPDLEDPDSLGYEKTWELILKEMME